METSTPMPSPDQKDTQAPMRLCPDDDWGSNAEDVLARLIRTPEDARQMFQLTMKLLEDYVHDVIGIYLDPALGFQEAEAGTPFSPGERSSLARATWDSLKMEVEDWGNYGLSVPMELGWDEIEDALAVQSRRFGANNGEPMPADFIEGRLLFSALKAAYDRAKIQDYIGKHSH